MPRTREIPLLEDCMHGDDGYLKPLHVTKGDAEITFRPGDEQDVARAKALVEDAMKLGYTIMVKDKLGRSRRVTKFDPDKKRYVIGDKREPEQGAVPLEQAQATVQPPPDRAAPARPDRASDAAPRP